MIAFALSTKRNTHKKTYIRHNDLGKVIICAGNDAEKEISPTPSAHTFLRKGSSGFRSYRLLIARSFWTMCTMSTPLAANRLWISCGQS